MAPSSARNWSAGIWLAEHWGLLPHGETVAGLTHPRRIKEWYEEQQHTALLPADLSDIQAESIETTAAEQRELWRDVGEALLVGRRMHKADQKFSQWCKEMGFDMKPPVRSDAMWLDEVSDDPTPVFPPGMIHPTNIRKWHREGRLPLFREWKHSPTTPPGTGEPATATPRGDPPKVCGEKFSSHCKALAFTSQGDQGKTTFSSHSALTLRPYPVP